MGARRQLHGLFRLLHAARAAAAGRLRHSRSRGLRAGLSRHAPVRFRSAARRGGAAAICAKPRHASPRVPPARTFPAFIDAFRKGDERKAYEIIRARDVLPELTSRLSPAWLESEGACIETTLTGVPVPILDMQYAVSWRARERGETGVRIPEHSTGKRVAVVGGGPAGIAAAIRLLELGHCVDLYESTDHLVARRGASFRTTASRICGRDRRDLRPALAKGARASCPQPHEPATEGQPKNVERGDETDEKKGKNGKDAEEADGRACRFISVALGKTLGWRTCVPATTPSSSPSGFGRSARWDPLKSSPPSSLRPRVFGSHRRARFPRNPAKTRAE